MTVKLFLFWEQNEEEYFSWVFNIIFRSIIKTNVVFKKNSIFPSKNIIFKKQLD